MLLWELARPLLVEAPLAHGIAAIAAVVAEITVSDTTRHQAVAVIALVAQVTIRAVAHPVFSLVVSCDHLSLPSQDSATTPESTRDGRRAWLPLWGFDAGPTL